MVKKIKDKSGIRKMKEVQKDLVKKINMFDRMDDECTACQEPFDKTDIEQVSTWRVAVRPEQEKVNLYCPTCWSRAQATIADFRKRVEKRNNENS